MTTIVPPASQGEWDASSSDSNGTVTDTDSIVSTAHDVDQKSGSDVDAIPNQPVTNTALTAVDGTLTTDGDGSSRRRSISGERLTSRVDSSSSNYELVFSGTGTGPNCRDASIEGTAYLTYSLVSNATYNVEDCLKKCDEVDMCGK